MAKERTTPKTEALGALKTAREILARPEPLAGARLAQFRGLLDFIEEQVGAIRELKKVPAEKPAAAQEASHV